MITRKKGFYFLAFVFTIFYSITTCLIYFGVSSSNESEADDYYPPTQNLTIFPNSTVPSFALVYDQNFTNHSFVLNVSRTIKEMISTDLKVTPNEIIFNNINDFNSWVFDVQKNETIINLIFGLEIKPNLTNDNMDITILYNSTSKVPLNNTYIQIERVLWKSFGLGDMNLRYIELKADPNNLFVFSLLIPLFLIFSFFGYIAIVLSVSTADCRSPKRPYVLNSNISLVTYWIGTIASDMIFWIIICFIFFIPLCIIGLPLFREHPILSIIAMILHGIPILIIIYCFSFMFTDPEKSPLAMFLYFLLAGIYFLSLLVSNPTVKSVLNWVFGLIPPSNFVSILMNLSLPTPGIWSYEPVRTAIISMLINLIIYPLLIALIEHLMISVPIKNARKEFLSYEDYFSRIKTSRPSTEEAQKAAQEAENGNPNDFAVRVCHASRLFFDNEKKVIPAVNNVSFGIKAGTIYGFLGSNGAGKTTLLNMITGTIPLSSGTIEVNGQNIQSSSYHNISICPQFNDHLVNEMTVIEHINVFCNLYNFSETEYIEFRDKFIEKIKLTEHANKLVSELSGGNARKLAIILSLLNPSNVVLLDEPTSSLDPIARHCVHDIINEFRGQKTFMLCTHLLDEAEFLCDVISIMFHGCVFVVETPQYLSSKFGTEWKVDLLLDNESQEIDQNVTNFFLENLPSATLSIKRPKNRIYSIPSDSIEIVSLFRLLKNAVERNIGIKFFTCSSSTLEKVFLELVIKSE